MMAIKFGRDAHTREFLLNTAQAMAAFGVMVVVEKLILMPFLGQRMNSVAFGELLLMRNTATLLASGIFAGLHNLLLRRNVEWVGIQKGIAVRSAALLGGLIASAVCFLLIFGLLLAGRTEWLRNHWLGICAFSGWGITNIVYFICQTYWRMHFRMRIFYSLQAFNGIMLLLVIPLYACLNDTGIYIGWLAAGVTPLIVTGWLASREDTFFGGRWFDMKLVWQMSREMWVFVWGVVGQALLQNMDRFIIAGLLGAAAVSAYFKVTNTAYMVLVPVEPIAGLLLSMAAQKQANSQTRDHWWRLHGLMVVIVTGALLGGVVCGPWLTDQLYGAGTFAAHPELFWIILTGCLCAIVSILLRGLLIVYVNASWIVWHDTLTLLALLLLCTILTYSYGLTGAAVAVTVSLVLRAILSELVVAVTLRHHHS